jgi:hypothetical protein
MNHPDHSKLLILVFFVLSFSLLFSAVPNSKSQTSDTIIQVFPAQSTPKIGETITVNITISNVQNLYAIDLTLQWNSAVLQILQNQSLIGDEANGILYSPTITVTDTASQETGKYTLIATSQNPANSFNGSGTIATLTFNVTSIGHSALTLQSELADHPLPEQTSESINHTIINGSVDAVIPEFPSITILAIVIIAATAALLISRNIRITNKRLISTY